jgi:hypothetical protein
MLRMRVPPPTAAPSSPASLLAFARKSRLEPKPTDLTHLVSANFVDVIESSVGSSIDLELNLRRRLPKVMVDPSSWKWRCSTSS